MDNKIFQFHHQVSEAINSSKAIIREIKEIGNLRPAADTAAVAEVVTTINLVVIKTISETEETTSEVTVATEAAAEVAVAVATETTVAAAMILVIAVAMEVVVDTVAASTRVVITIKEVAAAITK